MTIDDKVSCENGLHFPERIYFWPLLRAYYAHCAICGTDYYVMHSENREEDERKW